MDRLARLLPLLVVGLAAAFAFRRLSNTDTWWHLASGRWIVAHGSVPHLDTLSWTVPDHLWINVQWLFDVIIYGIYSLGGTTLLVASAAMAYAASTALMLVNVRRHIGPVAAAVLCTWVVLISQERFEIRPEMMSYLFLSLMLWLYATGRDTDSRRLWAVPIVMCLWANSHSLFVLGMVIIISQMVGSLITDLTILPSGWRRPIGPAVRKRLLGSGAEDGYPFRLLPVWARRRRSARLSSLPARADPKFPCIAATIIAASTDAIAKKKNHRYAVMEYVMK